MAMHASAAVDGPRATRTSAEGIPGRLGAAQAPSSTTTASDALMPARPQPHVRGAVRVGRPASAPCGALAGVRGASAPPQPAEGAAGSPAP
jgi:hypothetical protein